jgi:serine/threonine protein kinase
MTDTTYIGSGSYGCVYRPALRCIGEKERREGISKLQLYKDSVAEYRKNQSILEDDDKSYHCKPNLKGITLNQSCPKGDLGMIVYPDYGEPLSSFVNMIVRTKGSDRNTHIKNLVTGLSEIFRGIDTMNDNNKYHRDIHSGNILIDKDGRFRIIDYGLAVNLDINDDPYVDEPPAVWPPEALLLVSGEYETHYSDKVVGPILREMADVDVTDLHRKIDVFGFGEVLENIVGQIGELKKPVLVQLIADMTELRPSMRVDITDARKRFNEFVHDYLS